MELWRNILNQSRRLCLKHDLLPDFEQNVIEPGIGAPGSKPHMQVDFYCEKTNCDYSCIFTHEVVGGKVVRIQKTESGECARDRNRRRIQGGR